MSCRLRQNKEMNPVPPIYVMIKPASGLCNMHCQYCFYADEMQNRQQSLFGIMSEETMNNVIREVLSFAEGSCTIAFQGGEPTLAGLNFFRRCLELEEKYNVNHVRISHSIQTNGYALNEQWCRFLAENHFLVGISLDGIKATHDVYRKNGAGEGTYHRVIESIRMLKKAGVDFNVLTVVNRKTAPRIKEIYESYKKQEIQWQQYIACLDPIGSHQGCERYSLTPAAYGKFLIALFDLWEADLRCGKQPYIRQFENYIGILMGHPPEACEHRGICGLQTIVEADGSVYPCDFYVLDEYKLGNLNEDTLRTIDGRRKELQFVERSAAPAPECKRCPYWGICRGGCCRHREQPDGSIGQNCFCEGYKMFFDARINQLRRIAASISC